MSMHPAINYFAKFKRNHRIFIETGSYRGDGIQLALDAGYEEIYSIDNDKANVDYCAQRFDRDPRVTLLHGDSPEVLRELLKGVNEPAMFWLDAHSQLMEGEEDNYPLIKELCVLAVHKTENGINSHTIMVDDWLMMTHQDVTGWDRTYVLDFIRRVNRLYNITYLSNPIKNNILLAHI